MKRIWCFIFGHIPHRQWGIEYCLYCSKVLEER